MWQMEWPHLCWLMLLPKVAEGIATYLMAEVIATCGRWNGHIFFDMADVIVILVDGIVTWLEYVQEDLIALVADGKATGSIYFNFSSLLLIRTSSHI